MTEADRRTAARWVGLGLLAVMTVGIVNDAIQAAASAAYLDGHAEGRARGMADGYVAGQIDAYRELGIGQPGPPGSPGPSGP